MIIKKPLLPPRAEGAFVLTRLELEANAEAGN